MRYEVEAGHQRNWPKLILHKYKFIGFPSYFLTLLDPHMVKVKTDPKIDGKISEKQLLSKMELVLSFVDISDTDVITMYA